MRKTAIKAGFGAILLASLTMNNTAYAQSAPEQTDNADRPVAATTAPAPAEDEALPQDMQPEKLTIPKAVVIDPNNSSRARFGSQNRWDPTTLTQSTGLSAASVQRSTNTAPSQDQEDVSNNFGVPQYATDLLSTEDLLNVGEIVLPGVATSPSNRQDGIVSLSSSLRGALFDLPTDNVNASVFKLDLGGLPCLGTADECRANEYNKIDVGYAKNITHGKMNGLNLQLTPRAGLRFNEDSKSALVGALVRIGDNLREGSELKSNAWYVFAGADAEAVSYSPTGVRRLTSGEFHLQDRIIVGDAQAGLGYRMGSADLSLTYFKRQATAENYSYNEDAAALSLTWKR